MKLNLEMTGKYWDTNSAENESEMKYCNNQNGRAHFIF